MLPVVWYKMFGHGWELSSVGVEVINPAIKSIGNNCSFTTSVRALSPIRPIHMMVAFMLRMGMQTIVGKNKTYMLLDHKVLQGLQTAAENGADWLNPVMAFFDTAVSSNLNVMGLQPEDLFPKSIGAKDPKIIFVLHVRQFPKVKHAALLQQQTTQQYKDLIEEGKC